RDDAEEAWRRRDQRDLARRSVSAVALAKNCTKAILDPPLTAASAHRRTAAAGAHFEAKSNRCR
ncbi:hypothetical protein, partial [Collimonas sp.]|uniref:hypothetical protein n=1 Tax=Collimonas sp. TaxID=1963772 RepID=UPI002CC4306A